MAGSRPLGLDQDGSDRMVVPRSFFDRPTLELAPALLGLILVHETPAGIAAGRIVEVEAYCGPEDRAAHSFGGRHTPRTAVMFEQPGLTYVYRSYGIHVCFDVVSGPVGTPEAILVRALDPLQGRALMERRRSHGRHSLPPSGPATVRWLCGGPGRLTEALAITMAANRHPLWTAPLYLADDGWRVGAAAVRSGPRIGIDGAKEARHYPWRFWIDQHPAVSRSETKRTGPPPT